MEINNILVFLAALASGFIAPLIRDYWARRKLETEAELDISDAAQKIANSSASAVAVIEGLLKRFETKFKDQEEKIGGQEGEINNLRARLTAMQIDEQKRERVDGERNKAISDKIEALEDYIKVLIDTLRKHDIEIPKRPKMLTDRETLDKITAVQFPRKPGETK